MAEFDIELDASGLNCPMPVLQCKKKLHNMESGQVLHLIATDVGAKDDIPKLLEHIDSTLIESSEGDNKYHFYIKKS